MSRSIIYFVNPISGTHEKDVLVKKIEAATRFQQIPFKILPTNAAGNYYYLKEKISREQVTDIVICGGDGTVNQVAAALVDEDVNIGIIPMGSGNGLALAANIPNNIDKALSLIFTGKAAYIDAFFINDRFSCMLCGLGFDAQVAHDFAQQKKRGLASYIKQTLRNFLTATPWNFEIINKGKSIVTPAYFISIANSNQFGNHFTIAPQASLRDGLLDIVVVTKMSKWKLVWAVLQQVRKGVPAEIKKGANNNSKVLYFQTDQLIIHNPGGAPLHIDGDPAATAPKFVIEVIPAAFKLIQPC